MQQQADALLQDTPIAGCKIGVVPNTKIARSIAEIITQLSGIPIVLDPVLTATSGKQFSDPATVEAIKNYLLPLVTVITPNFSELKAMTAMNRPIESRIQELCALGSNYVLLTGADESTQEVTNTLYSEGDVIEQYEWPRLPHSYHGSGCTLSSALACYLAQDFTITEAARKGSTIHLAILA